MEKLTFYSLSSPEKLDRIGEYLFQRASRDIYRFFKFLHFWTIFLFIKSIYSISNSWNVLFVTIFKWLNIDYRRRNGFVVIAMEAMDQLLVACHAQTLNLFVESFLKMVQKLLESTDPQLLILATQSVSFKRVITLQGILENCWKFMETILQIFYIQRFSDGSLYMSKLNICKYVVLH